jgi:hypothetical protein
MRLPFVSLDDVQYGGLWMYMLLLSTLNNRHSTASKVRLILMDADVIAGWMRDSSACERKGVTVRDACAKKYLGPKQIWDLAIIRLRVGRPHQRTTEIQKATMKTSRRHEGNKQKTRGAAARDDRR